MRTLALWLVLASASACGEGRSNSDAPCSSANDCGGDAVCSDQGQGLHCYEAQPQAAQQAEPDAVAEPDAPDAEPKLDACEVDNGGCAPEVQCTSDGESSSCGACPHGYTGDGHGQLGCADVDECAEDKSDCTKEQVCVNQRGSYRCDPCPSDHRIDAALGCITKATRLIGTSGDEHARGIAVDESDDIYVAGSTNGGLEGASNRGGDDGFLVKYDRAGQRLWSRQFGTNKDEIVTDVVSDGNGNSYVFGNTEGAFEGSHNAGGYDLFIAKHDRNGELQWIEEFGSAGDDYASGAAVDDAGTIVYVTGFTQGDLDGHGNAGSADLFVAKFDAHGARQWLRQTGGAQSDTGTAVAIDGDGAVLVSGETEGAYADDAHIGGSDVVILKYDAAGHQAWAHQVGTSASESVAAMVTVEASNAFVAGSTLGTWQDATSAGDQDGFLIKYDGAGTEHWTRQFGSSSLDSVAGVSIDNFGNAYVTGTSQGVLEGSSDAAGMFLVKYDSNGVRVWSRQFGSELGSVPADIAIDFHDHVYVTGFTSQGLDGLELAGGNTDGFVLEFDSDGNPL